MIVLVIYFIGGVVFYGILNAIDKRFDCVDFKYEPVMLIAFMWPFLIFAIIVYCIIIYLAKLVEKLSLKIIDKIC